MTRALILDPNMLEEVRARRRKLGVDRWDEVWDGVAHMVPSPSAEHQRIEKLLLRVLLEVVEDDGLGQIFHELNVADPQKGLGDFRIPDLSVVLRGSGAELRETFIAGGPDLVVEIRSPGDESYEKVPWYATQGVREVLIIDQDTKVLALYRLRGRQLEPVARGESVTLEAVPLRLERFVREQRPHLRIVSTGEPERSWEI